MTTLYRAAAIAEACLQTTRAESGRGLLIVVVLFVVLFFLFLVVLLLVLAQHLFPHPHALLAVQDRGRNAIGRRHHRTVLAGNDLFDGIRGVAVVALVCDAVVAGELEAVEQGGGTANIHGIGREGVDDGGDGHLNGGAIFQRTQVRDARGPEADGAAVADDDTFGVDERTVGPRLQRGLMAGVHAVV